jgi:phage terminase large subunit
VTYPVDLVDYKTALEIEAFERRRMKDEERRAREIAAANERAPEDHREIVVRFPGRPSLELPVLEDPKRVEHGSPASSEADGEIGIDTPSAFEYLFDPPLGDVRYRVAYGGRGKAASWSFARALLAHGTRQRLRILCAREFQSSMKDSVHKLLSDQIDGLTLRTFYDVQTNAILGRNGTEFIFKGIRKNINEIKSTEGIDVCWVEEAESVTDHSWQVLIPTVRKPGSEIWVSFNPLLPTDSTYKRFVANPPAARGPIRAIIRKVSWRDNPWLPDVLRAEKDALFLADPEAAAHVWDGEPWTRSDAQVLSGKWIVDDFVPDPRSWLGPYHGVDWGFAMDPTVWVRVWIYDNRLYLEYESGGVQLDNDQTADAAREIPALEKYEVRGDSARPETIREMQKRGLKVKAVDKWTGSVEDGIAYLRTFDKIVIHPRCKRAQNEARLWRYKTDPRTEEILPVLQDGNDHVWDGVRYALAPMIRERPRRGSRRRSVMQEA